MLPKGFRPMGGDVLICDYGPDPRSPSTFPLHRPPVGMAPEMWKERHVVVLATNAEGRLAVVVPLSTQEPTPQRGYHSFIAAGRYPFIRKDSWIKADMVMSVSLDRLDRLIIGGHYGRASLTKADFKACRIAALNALGLGHLWDKV